MQNVIRQIVVLSEGPLVDVAVLPREIQTTTPMARLPQAEAFAAVTAFAESTARQTFQAAPRAKIEPLEVSIRRIIEAAVEQCGGSIPRAAAALDVAPSTLYRRIQSWQEAEDQRLAS